MPDAQPASDIAVHPLTNTLLGSALAGVAGAFTYIVKMGTRVSVLETKIDRLDHIEAKLDKIITHLIEGE